MGDVLVLVEFLVLVAFWVSVLVAFLALVLFLVLVVFWCWGRSSCGRDVVKVNRGRGLLEVGVGGNLGFVSWS